MFSKCIDSTSGATELKNAGCYQPTEFTSIAKNGRAEKTKAPTNEAHRTFVIHTRNIDSAPSQTQKHRLLSINPTAKPKTINFSSSTAAAAQQFFGERCG